MKKVSVIGHFGFGKNLLNGQTVKTKIIAEALCDQYGEKNVFQIDTHGGVKNLLKSPIYVFEALRKSQNVVMLPAHNGLRVFGRLLPFVKKIFKNRKIHYVVIGGWLPEFIKTKKGLAKSLRNFDGIYVETQTMKNALEAQNFCNIFVMPNCKMLSILKEEELVYSMTEPYKLCTFSRVMREKGIGEAVNAVKAVNESLGRIVYTLDIYGQIDVAQVEWFDELQKTFPHYIKYGGVVPYDESVKVLKSYFALLFPTRFYTEGIPGTIIDAYAAGIPIISSKWESFSDIVDDGVTGIGYEFNNSNDLEKILLDISNNIDELNALKSNCLKKSETYIPEYVIEVLKEKFV